MFFCVLIVRLCSRACVQKWGAQHDMPENPYFCIVSWGLAAQQLSQQVREISAGTLWHHAENEALGNGFSVLHVRYHLVASIGADTGMFWRSAKTPRIARKMGFLDLRSGNCHPNLKMRVLKKAKIHFLGPAHEMFVFFLARLHFSQNRFFKIDRFWLKPL